MILWAGINGHLDDVPVADVGRFEKELYAFLHSRYADIGQAIRDKKELTDDIVARLTKAVGEFKSVFGSQKSEVRS